MNRIINVNIGGIIFQIDEMAFRKLESYLRSLKQQFRAQEGGDEIIGDIESRIAELFQEQLDAGTEAIMDHDVEKIIGIMGTPDEYEMEDDTQNTSSSKTKTEDFQYYQAPRRFFRNPDDKFLGGVCGGLGSYFNLDPLIFRLIFVIFLFAWGTGVLLYILLWILLPEAVTTADKLQMRGEPVNINSIQKSIKEEAERIKSRIQGLSESTGPEINESLKKGNSSFRSFAGDFFSLFEGFLRILLKIIVVALLVAAAVTLISLIFGLGGVFNAVAFYSPDLGSYLFESGHQQLLVTLSILLLCGIPLLVLLYKVMKYLLKVETSTRPLDWTMFIFWIVGLFIFGGVASKVSLDFQRIGKVKDQKTYTISMNDGLTIQLDKSGERALNEDFDYMYDINECRVYDDTVIFRDIELDILPAKDSLVSLSLVKSARGNTKQKGKGLASRIDYNPEIEDSILSFPGNFSIGKDKLWRNQQLDLTLRIPSGRRVVLHPSINRILDDVQTNAYISDSDLLGKELIMTDTGLEVDSVSTSQLQTL